MSNKKLEIEYIQNRLSEYGAKMVGEYSTTIEGIDILCSCGHIRSTQFYTFLKPEDSHLCNFCSRARLSTEQVREVVENYGCKLDGKYVNAKTKIKIICPCGNSWKVLFNNFRNEDDYHVCWKCCGKRRELDTKFISEILDEYNYDLLSEYADPKKHIKILCRKCGNDDFICFHDLEKRVPSYKCKFCKRIEISDDMKNYIIGNGYIILDKEKIIKNLEEKVNIEDRDGYRYFMSYEQIKHNINTNTPTMQFYSNNPHSLYNISVWLAEKNKAYRVVGGKYSYKKKTILLHCDICDWEWKNCWNYIWDDAGCPSCSGRVVSKNNSLSVLYPLLSLEWDYDKNIGSPKDYSYGSHYHAFWVCAGCGYNWPAEIHSRTTTGNGCPHCSSSKGEKETKKFLMNNNINFIPQYRDILCRNEKPLPFDFAILNSGDSLLYLLEIQGKQHYFSIEHFGGEKAFIRRQENDRIKEEFCVDNNIPLIKIKYTEFKNINSILTELLL